MKHREMTPLNAEIPGGGVSGDRSPVQPPAFSWTLLEYPGFKWSGQCACIGYKFQLGPRRKRPNILTDARFVGVSWAKVSVWARERPSARQLLCPGS